MIEHILNLDFNSNEKLENLFKSISEGNTILFLGAGASVTKANKFLSQDIIDFFEDKKNISWGIKDITEFVDVLSNNPNYSRDEFDNYVDECLRKLKVSETHLSIAKNSWRLIITTNYDLLIENAFNQIEGTHEEVSKLKVSHNNIQYHSIQAKDEIKYVKINGCISNKRDYKLVFSSDDFKKAEKFYRSVLNDLRNLSDRISFLSIGYSYTDDFAKKLLQKLDSYNFRDGRVIYNIDPFVNEAALPLYSTKRICVIKATSDEFFQAYNLWKEEKEIIIRKHPFNHFTNSQNNDLFIPAHITKRIGNNLKQLNSYYRSKIIPDSEFYKGEEPDYSIILKNYDVVKSKQIEEVTKFISDSLSTGQKSRVIPLFFLTGTFGTGKSTFAYRLLNKLTQNQTSTLSFEIMDPSELSVVDLKEIFIKSASSVIYLYVNTIEINTIFRSLLDLRNKLSIEIPSDVKIILIATIRENVYLKFKEDKEIKNSFAMNVDCKFSYSEIEELVDKLKNSGSIFYRDLNEKKAIIDRIFKEFSGDSYISLLELVSGNKLIDDLMEAYHQLSEKCKKAFIYTSILYQYKITMPASLLCSLVTSDWLKFRDEVIEKDGKGILIQEIVESVGTDPDLYFRTKHPIISKKLIGNLLNEDTRFQYIKSIVTHIIRGSKNSRLLINFFKAMIVYKDISYTIIDHLYDLADEHLSEDSYFLLYYAINLQHRRTEEAILKAISKIQLTTTTSEKESRNHYLIHRRGVLLFELAKLIFKRGLNHEYYKVVKYINEARDFLEIKVTLDPFSSFSYVDLLELEIWCLENLNEEINAKLKSRIHIEELFDISTKTVFENANRIFEIKNKYLQNHRFNNNESEYFELLQEYYNNSVSRPYALILLFNHFLSKEDYDTCLSYLTELENLSLNSDVQKLLLKYYGRNLFDIQIRLKFFSLIKTHPELENSENLRLNYFGFISECYSRNFGPAYNYLSNIKERFHHINPDFNQVWIDNESKAPALFEAILKMGKNGKTQFYIPDLGLWAKPENWDNEWKLHMQFDVELHFYIYGIRAEAVNIILDEFENLDISAVDEIEL